MKHRIAFGLVLGLALSAQANPPSSLVPQKVEGEVVMQQTTIVRLGPTGQPVATERQIRITMTDGHGLWSTLPAFPYAVTDASGQISQVDPLTFEDAGEPFIKKLNPAAPIPATGIMPRVVEAHKLPKRVEDGVTIAGSAQVEEWPAAGKTPAHTERTETWFRVMRGADGRAQMRLHKSIVKTDDEIRTTDMWYFPTNRLHRSMFSSEVVVK